MTINSDTSKLDSRKSTTDVTLTTTLGAPDPADGGGAAVVELDLETQV